MSGDGDVKRVRWVEIVLVLVVLMFGGSLILPMLSPGRGPHRETMELWMVRSINRSMFSFSESNNGYFPGLTSQGHIADHGEPGSAFLPNLNGASVEHRYAFLLSTDSLAAEQLISYADRKEVWSDPLEPVTEANYSYALLRLHDDATLVGDRLAEERLHRRAQTWRDDFNSESAHLAVRAMKNDQGVLYSFHTRRPGQMTTDAWRGTVGWADNHVGFETTHELDTQYGSGPSITDDHLFRTDQGNATFAVPGEGPWDEVMDSANAVLDAVGSSAGVEATRMTGE